MTTELTAQVMLERGRKQEYKFRVKFRLNRAKVEQDRVLGYAADHRWIKPPQRP